MCDGVAGFLLQDVAFELNATTDSPMGIAEELVQAGLITVQDCGQVANYLDQLLLDIYDSSIHDSSAAESITFPLHEVASDLPDGCDGTAPQLPPRQGFVHATIVVVAAGVANSADVNQADVDGRTPLFVAAREGHEAVVRTLLTDAGADVNKTRAGGYTPLYVAAQDGHLGVVRLLVTEGGVDAGRTMTDDGVGVLYIAAQEGHADVVRFLVTEAGVRSTTACRGGAMGPDGVTPLMIAVHAGHEAVVRLLVSHTEADVNLKNSNGETAVWVAAQNGHEGIVRFLVTDAGASPRQPDIDGLTPLNVAATGGHGAVVRFLAEQRGADVNQADSHGDTPLYGAAQNGHNGIVLYLIANHAADSNQANEYGITPLWTAARRGHEAVVRTLVNEGNADVDLANDDGVTPLSRAVWENHGGVVRFLVTEAHADATLANTNGETPFWGAAQEGHIDLVRFLATAAGVDIDTNQSDIDGNTPVWVAAKRGHLDVVRYLVTDAAADSDTANDYGVTPLWAAAENGNKAVVRFLASDSHRQRTGCWANVNHSDEDGMTPLHCAARRGHYDIVRFLVCDVKADANMVNKNGETAFWAAARGGDERLVRLLATAAGVDTDHADIDGAKPLWAAAKKGHEAVVRFLVTEAGADVNAQNNYGHTPLWTAACRGHAAVVRLLAGEADADVALADDDGVAPLWIAAQAGHEDIVRFLVIEARASANQCDGTGLSPLHVAVQGGCEAVVRCLVTECGANVNQVEVTDGRTPLLIAACTGHAGIARVLVGNGADINCNDREGTSPLLRAAMSGSIDVVRFLASQTSSVINAGVSALHIAVLLGDEDDVLKILSTPEGAANASLTSPGGSTMLHLAAAAGHEAIVRLLVAEGGADVNSVDDAGGTPALAAVRNGHTRCVFLLRELGAAIPLEFKQGWLAAQLDGVVSSSHANTVKLCSDRDNLLNGVSAILGVDEPTGALVRDVAAAPLDVQFIAENGSGDGVRREWFELVANEVLDEAKGLFVSKDGGKTLQPRARRSCSRDHLSFFTLLGRIAGLALFHHEHIPAPWTTAFVKAVFGYPIELEDLDAVNPELYAGKIVYIRDRVYADRDGVSLEDLGLTFEAEFEDVDQEYACRTPSRARRMPVELKPGGCNIAVTEENRIEYLELFVEHRLVGTINMQIEAFRKGLAVFFGPELLEEFRQLCDPADAQLLLCGTADIDLDDWLAHTEYTGLSWDAPVACYFWDVVRSMSAEHRAKLLHFCTGSSRVLLTLGFDFDHSSRVYRSHMAPHACTPRSMSVYVRNVSTHA